MNVVTTCLSLIMVISCFIVLASTQCADLSTLSEELTYSYKDTYGGVYDIVLKPGPVLEVSRCNQYHDWREYTYSLKPNYPTYLGSYYGKGNETICDPFASYPSDVICYPTSTGQEPMNFATATLNVLVSVNCSNFVKPAILGARRVGCMIQIEVQLQNNTTTYLYSTLIAASFIFIAFLFGLLCRYLRRLRQQNLLRPYISLAHNTLATTITTTTTTTTTTRDIPLTFLVIDQSHHSYNRGKSYLSDDCVVCCERPVAVIFVSCMHGVACLECLPKLTKCPICRTPITACQHVDADADADADDMKIGEEDKDASYHNEDSKMIM
eukprot:TRINITY_DN4616_c0_g1_i1.p1 TRINITY_DN4616_c0_g1~~TRINITY_DN4616_c0_g1_i1.p1  ORF type:complete len:325 (-),score=24.91 TRINITY_DN4616_c0_g1_i1:51-1025(-)